MNTSPYRPEVDGLRPTAERNLPAGRHRFHKERLMAQIHEDLDAQARPGPVRRNPFLRRAILLPAAACALAGAVAAGAVLLPHADADRSVAAGPALTTTVDDADPKGAVQLLDRISLAAEEAPGQAARPGQYAYIESKTAGLKVENVNGEYVQSEVPLHTRQMWISSDGGQGWIAEPQQNVDSPLSVLRVGRIEWPSRQYLASLPTDPDALLKKIREEIAFDGTDAEAFMAIGTLLEFSRLPAPLTSALYKAAAEIPGVAVVNDATDAIGRHGVAVARLNEKNGQRSEWIFDRSTYALLGARTVQVGKPAKDQVQFKRGTVLSTTAITERAVVDEMKQAPADTKA